jgi:TatD DNase family protein
MIDTHCHLNDTSAFADVDSEIAFAREHGVDRMIVVGVRPEEWESTVKLIEDRLGLYGILGWHPNYTADFSTEPLAILKRLLGHPKILAVGEIGLDYHWEHSPRSVQHFALLAQLDLAEHLDVPVVFHAREAYSDLLAVLESRPSRPYLFHCFAGDENDAQRAMALDASFGIDGPITYKKSDRLREIVRGLPLNRIVLETDAPYLSPLPYRGKPNRPGHVHLVAGALAVLLDLPEEEIDRITTANAERFFRLCQERA